MGQRAIRNWISRHSYHSVEPTVKNKKLQNRVTLTQAAQQLGVSATVVKRCIAQGTLPARQVVPYAPWIIQRTALALPAVQAVVQAVRMGRRQRRAEQAGVH